ncbi:hypothetical protein MJL27_25845, partial [Salmonella enterica subsp. enterica serovar Anatum]|nr:hypothetical protein [Salmonella enterica subsp. enterica serovar Anatum]
ILPAQPYRDGIAQCPTGAPNEVWSYGEEVCDVLTGCLALREKHELKIYFAVFKHDSLIYNSGLFKVWPFISCKKCVIYAALQSQY